MSLIDFIEKLQKKPRYIRFQIMWATVVVCMAVIFVFWLWSLSKEMDLNNKQAQKEVAWGEWSQIKKDLPSLWQSLGAGIGNVFESIKEELKNSEPAESAAPSVTPTASFGQEGILPVE